MNIGRHRKSHKQKQMGMTTLATLFVVFIAGFFLTVAFKLGPHYLDNRIVQAAITQVGDSDIIDKSDTEIRRKIADFFTINNIRDIDISKVVIAREAGATRISLDYEKRFPMFGNVDVVLTFSNQYDTAQRHH